MESEVAWSEDGATVPFECWRQRDTHVNLADPFLQEDVFASTSFCLHSVYSQRGPAENEQSISQGTTERNLCFLQSNLLFHWEYWII